MRRSIGRRVEDAGQLERGNSHAMASSFILCGSTVVVTVLFGHVRRLHRFRAAFATIETEVDHATGQFPQGGGG